MIIRVLKDPYFLVAIFVGLCFEIITVYLSFRDFGHAGPKGVGWICLIPNLPGTAITARLIGQPDSMLAFGSCVLLIQMTLIVIIAFLIRYRAIRKYPTGAISKEDH